MIDTGAQPNHPDLKPVIAGGFNLLGTGPAGDYSDLNRHGTHTAGLVGARGNNGVGVSGVAWNVRQFSVLFSFSLPFFPLSGGALFFSFRAVP